MFSKRRGSKSAAVRALKWSAAAAVEQMEPRVLLVVHPLTDIPVLHSRPNAAHSIYLDFNGAAAFIWDADIPPDQSEPPPMPMMVSPPLEHAFAPDANELASYDVPATAAFSTDANRSNFTDAEINDIRDIWARVADFFSPFNVDVTTVDPGTLADGVAMRVIVGGMDQDWRETFTPIPPYTLPRTPYVENGAAGFGSFTNTSKDNIAFVFSDFLDTRKKIAETIGHQVGVSMGLHDQAVWVPTMSGFTYVADYENGNANVGPIMGDPSGADRAVWWSGDITATVGTTAMTPPRTHGFQDDLGILYGLLATAADDHDESFRFAKTLAINTEQATTVGTGASGTLETGGDTDSFKFTTVAGTVNFTVSSVTGGMLSPDVTIRDYLGNNLDFASAGNGSSVNVSVQLVEGSYTIEVSSSAGGNSKNNVGQFVITGTIPQGVVDDPFSGAVFVPGTAGDDKITVTVDPDGKIRANVNGKNTRWDPTVTPINRVVVLADTGPTTNVEGGDDKIVIGTGVPRAYILAGGGFDTVQGGDFNDSIVGGGGSQGNLIYGELGDDRITASGKGGFSFGGAGNDRIYGATSGSGSTDEIHGDAGNDRIYAGHGNDVVVGGNGNDTIYGGSGNDTIYGQEGNDLLIGEGGFDTIYGNNGNDTFFVRDQIVDSITGGAGTDQAQIDPDDEPDDPLNGDKVSEIEVFLT